MLSRSLLVLALTAGVASAQKTPEETVKSFTVAEGVQVELFAAEPMLINPTSMDIDHLGRVWVTEAVNYRRKNFGRPILREAGDRVVILTDKDGDGKADDSTVFYQGKELYGPLGIAVAKDAKGPGYKVFVCQSPDILLFTDADGDGKADGPPAKFLTGIGGFDHDHGVHGINIGPDGKLYFTIGDQGVQKLQSSDGKGRVFKSGAPDCLAGTVWKCDMDGTNLELIAHNFRNNYECCVNSFGEVWLSDNDDDGNQQTRICFVMPGGNYGYFPRGAGQTHWHEEQPGIVHKTMRTGFGSPTGICFYEGTLLPEKYRGQLLHCDAGPRELRAFLRTPKGAGLRTGKGQPRHQHRQLVPPLSDVCVAPDGSVMMADWYDPGVGGHGMGDWTRGRIYRLTPKGHKGYKVPEVKLDSKEGMTEALGSPCQATRAAAMAKLAEMAKDEVTALLKGVIAGNGAPTLRARAMMQASKLLTPDEAASNVFSPGFEDGTGVDVRFYELYLRTLKVPLPQKIGPSVRLFSFLPKETAPVSREIMIAARTEEAAIAKPQFYASAKMYDGQDIFYRAALNIACGTDPARRDAILADFDKHFPEWNDKVADLVWELRPKSVLPRLGKLLEDSKLTGPQKARIVDILASSPDASAGATMLSLLGSTAPDEVKARALDNLRLFLPTKWNALAAKEDLGKAIKVLLADPKTKLTGLQLVAAAKYSAGREDVAGIAGDRTLPLATRVEAIRTLGQLPSADSLKALIAIGQPENPLSVDVVKAIGLMLPTGQKNDATGPQALDALKQAIRAEKGTPELKSAALGALAGNRSGTQWLLEIRQNKEMPEALAVEAGRLLRNSPFAGERNKALLLFPAAGKLDPKKLPSAAELAKRTGNAQHGEQVFAASLKGETQCLRCHMVRGIGGQIGPDLSMIGKKGSKENLYDSLLTPSKAIADQYVQWKVNTSDGKSITGLQMSESETTRVIRDANGKDYVINKADEDGKPQKSLVSIMPDNLVAAFTEDEMVDVVEYLMTLKTASLTPESWNIIGPFPNDESDSALDKDFGFEGKLIDLGAKVKGKDGDVSWGQVRTNGTGYIDLTAHYAGKSVNSASYLQRTIDSPADQDGVILMGNDDGAKVWVNGAKVFENRDHFAATPGKHQIQMKLKKGSNVVLIKIVNGSDPHGFYFAATSEQELKVGK